MPRNQFDSAPAFTRFAAMIVCRPPVYFVALLGLCAAYLQGGIDKVLDFGSAVGEVQNFGLQPAVPFAAATILTEFVAPILILSGIYRWFGALWLAGFTLMATFLANRFWGFQMPERFAIENAFFEHLGLVGGFLLVAWYDFKSGNAAAVQAGRYVAKEQ